MYGVERFFIEKYLGGEIWIGQYESCNRVILGDFESGFLDYFIN